MLFYGLKTLAASLCISFRSVTYVRFCSFMSGCQCLWCTCVYLDPCNGIRYVFRCVWIRALPWIMSQGKLRCISSVCKPPFCVSYFNGFKVLIDIITQKNYVSNYTYWYTHTRTSHQCVCCDAFCLFLCTNNFNSIISGWYQHRFKIGFNHPINPFCFSLSA